MHDRSLVLQRARPGSVAAGMLGAFLLAGCSTLEEVTNPAATAPSGPLAEQPTSLKREQLVGNWGVASFREEKDRARVEAQARAQCRNPYRIALGPKDGVMMHIADDAKLYELRLKGASDKKTYLGLEAPPGDFNDREIVTLSDRQMVMRFVDPEIAARYGTFIYVRCA
jgi:hypothetical protein